MRGSPRLERQAIKVKSFSHRNPLRNCVVCGGSLTGKQIKYCSKKCNKKLERKIRPSHGAKGLSREDALDFFYYKWSGEKPSFANIKHECSRCKRKLLQEKFYTNRGHLENICKECRKVKYPNGGFKSPEERTAYYEKHKPKYLKGGKYFYAEKNRKYYQKNKERIIATVKAYNANNPSKVREAKRRYRKKRLATDPQYRARANLRKSLKTAIKKIEGEKSHKFSTLLGCSYEELSSHLESQFVEGMSWENYGEWHIDHVRPLSSFNLLEREEQLKCCNYTNLQPLWARDNLVKGDSWD